MSSAIRKLIAVVEILGGLFGCVVTLLLGARYFKNPLFALLVVVFTILYGLNFLAGLWLWQAKAKGIKLSLCIQILQTPVLSLPAVYYEFFSGLAAAVGIMGQSLTYKFYLGSQWKLYAPNNDTPPGAGINLMALFFFIYLLGQIWPKTAPK